jgi:polyphosphate kinase 2
MVMAKSKGSIGKGDADPKSASDQKKNHAKKSSTGPKFDIDDPKLPDAIEDASLTSGGFPYDKKLKREAYEDELRALQIELVKLQQHALKARERIIVLFEGRDAAGKGTCIGHFREHLNPRYARAVALPKPSETERGEWYLQRYITQFPTAGEMVFFDRSWYNRAGVERVMGFCSDAQQKLFLEQTPAFERLIVRDGIFLFKFYLEIGREMQLKRFHERRHDPVKQWKISDVDLAAIGQWDDYTRAKEDMLEATHTETAPWTVVLANDQRRARIETIRFVLAKLDYENKDAKLVGTPDARIVGVGPPFFETGH